MIKIIQLPNSGTSSIYYRSFLLEEVSDTWLKEICERNGILDSDDLKERLSDIFSDSIEMINNKQAHLVKVIEIVTYSVPNEEKKEAIHLFLKYHSDTMTYSEAQIIMKLLSICQ